MLNIIELTLTQLYVATPMVQRELPRFKRTLTSFQIVIFDYDFSMLNDTGAVNLDKDDHVIP